MWLRAVAAAGVLVSGAVHLVMWFNGVRDQHVVGPAFMLNAIGGLVIAVLLVAWDHALAALLAVGFGLSTLGAFAIATTVGLFGVHDSWHGGYVWTAAVAEAVAVVAGAGVLLRDRARPSATTGDESPRRRHRTSSIAVGSTRASKRGERA